MENISDALYLLKKGMLNSDYGGTSFYNQTKDCTTLLGFMPTDLSDSSLVRNRWLEKFSFFSFSKQNMINKCLFLNLDSLGVDVRVRCELSIP